MDETTLGSTKASENALAQCRRELELIREREQHYRRIFETMNDGFGLAEIIVDGRGEPYDYRFLEVNEAFGRLSGIPPAQVSGQTARELAPHVEPQWVETFAKVVFTGEVARFEHHLVALGKWFEVFAYRSEPGQFSFLFVDISERRRIQDALRRREQEFTALVERVPDIVARVDRALRLRYVNPAIERLSGRRRDWFLGKTPAALELSREEVVLRETALRHVFDSGRECVLEHKNPSLTGERYFQTRLVPEFGPDGNVETVLIVDRDIDDLKRAQRSLEELTLLDPLTGVANRRYLERFIKREWRREARHCLPVAVIMVDIDYFKAYNDRFGHAQGDYCLWRVAAALRDSLHRPADTLIRYGGEEFVALLPESDVSAAQEIAERLRQAVEGLNLPHVCPRTRQVTVSLGVAALNAQEGEFADLMAAADMALYRAKRKGRNRIETGP